MSVANCPATTTIPYTTTTSPPFSPPIGANGCLRVYFTCACPSGISAWNLVFADCVANSSCVGGLVCDPLSYYNERINGCVLSSGVPAYPDPLNPPCPPSCCPTTTTSTTTTTTTSTTTTTPPVTSTTTTPPYDPVCQVTWYAECTPQGIWSVGEEGRICTNNCSATQFPIDNTCYRTAISCSGASSCIEGYACTDSAPEPVTPIDDPPCCTTTTTSTTTPPPRGACQVDWYASCTPEGVWSVGQSSAVCTEGCAGFPFSNDSTCFRQARTCIYYNPPNVPCDVGFPCDASHAYPPLAPSDDPPCCHSPVTIPPSPTDTWCLREYQALCVDASWTVTPTGAGTCVSEPCDWTGFPDDGSDTQYGTFCIADNCVVGASCSASSTPAPPSNPACTTTPPPSGACQIDWSAFCVPDGSWSVDRIGAGCTAGCEGFPFPTDATCYREARTCVYYNHPDTPCTPGGPCNPGYGAAPQPLEPSDNPPCCQTSTTTTTTVTTPNQCQGYWSSICDCGFSSWGSPQFQGGTCVARADCTPVPWSGGAYQQYCTNCSDSDCSVGDPYCYGDPPSTGPTTPSCGDVLSFGPCTAEWHAECIDGTWEIDPYPLASCGTCSDTGWSGDQSSGLTCLTCSPNACDGRCPSPTCNDPGGSGFPPTPSQPDSSTFPCTSTAPPIYNYCNSYWVAEWNSSSQTWAVVPGGGFVLSYGTGTLPYPQCSETCYADGWGTLPGYNCRTLVSQHCDSHPNCVGGCTPTGQPSPPVNPPQDPCYG